MHLARFAQQHLSLVKRSTFAFCLWPLLGLVYGFYADTLGVNILETLTSRSGISALVLQLVALAITPLRHGLTRGMIHWQAGYGKRLSDWNWLISLRRMIGLFAFFYATLHVLFFVWLDQDFEWPWILEEMREKPYLVIGAIAYILLIPLAVTSTDRAMRALGRRWRTLHRSVYYIAILSVLHYLWQTKVGDYAAWPYIGVLALLLGYRLLIYFGLLARRPEDRGMILPER